MSNTGRFFIKRGNRTFVVEPIDNTMGKGREKWGDIDPATKKVTGSYGDKSVGAINEDESIITKENGFENIQYTQVGESPFSFIDRVFPE